MKTVYFDEKRKITKRKIKKITKKLIKINKKEKIALVMNDKLMRCEELIKEIKCANIEVLTREMAI